MSTVTGKKYRGVEEVFTDLPAILEASYATDRDLVLAVYARIKAFAEGCGDLESCIFRDPRWTDICLKYGTRFRRGVGAGKR